MSSNTLYPLSAIKNKKILFCVLNWGIGHATRSAVLIKALVQQENKITIASDEQSLLFLKNEFPSLDFITLPGYQINYPINRPLSFELMRQLPKICATIKKEKYITQTLENDFDLIISDNRYGCYSKKIPSYFITHQLNIQSPVSILSKLVNIINHRLIQKFKEVWIPDDEKNLTGALSQVSLNIPIHKIGLLSSFTEKKDAPKTIPLLIIISGPEPMRTDFEWKMIQYCKKYQLKCVIVGGNYQSQVSNIKDDSINYSSFCSRERLNELVISSEKIICRSGYSTIMDLFNANYCSELILIPTPGQTEQRYLADYLSKKYSHIQHISQESFFKS